MKVGLAKLYIDIYIYIYLYIIIELFYFIFKGKHKIRNEVSNEGANDGNSISIITIVVVATTFEFVKRQDSFSVRLSASVDNEQYAHEWH